MSDNVERRAKVPRFRFDDRETRFLHDLRDVAIPVAAIAVNVLRKPFVKEGAQPAKREAAVRKGDGKRSLQRDPLRESYEEKKREDEASFIPVILTAPMLQQENLTAWFEHALQFSQRLNGIFDAAQSKRIDDRIKLARWEIQMLRIAFNESRFPLQERELYLVFCDLQHPFRCVHQNELRDGQR